MTLQLQSGSSASTQPSSAILRAHGSSATTMKFPLAKVRFAEQKAKSCVGMKVSPVCVWKYENAHSRQMLVSLPDNMTLSSE